MNEGYDIIGDIHGHGDELHALLKKMGYHLRHGAFAHPSRKAIFVGDLIDRGTQNRMVIDTVCTMVNAGSALAIMGNHEFNAWAFHYEDARFDWLRPRNNRNLTQHISFLYEYMDPRRSERGAELNGAIEFFASLPLFLDLGELRVIHACWQTRYLRELRPQLRADHSAPTALLIEGHRPGSERFKQLEVLLKGPEIPLPEGLSYRDSSGVLRTRARIRWWLNEASELRQLAMLPGTELSQLTATETEQQATPIAGYPADAPPVFFGHYWQTGEPRPLADNVACVDYSMGLGEKLVAYRWSGETRLLKNNFFWVSP